MKLITRSSGKLFLILCLLVIFFSTSSSAAAQDASPISNPRAAHVFGEKITFEADLLPGTDFESAYLTFQTPGTNQSVVLTAEQDGGTKLKVEFNLANQNPIPAFSWLNFWFTLEFADGSKTEGQKVSYLLTDNRFSWQTHQLNASADINWIEGDLTLAQLVEDVIHQHQADFGRYLDLPYPEELHIYIYPSNSAFQSALEISNTPWAAGHANPDQDTILVAIPPGFDQQLDIQRKIPHEIAHIQLSLYLNGHSDVLPAWFSEGIASLAESFTAPEYWQIMQAAFENGSLLPLEDLCNTFPYDSDEAALAYAESESFVRYLNTRFGKSGLQTLLDTYSEGQTCQNGINQALGSSLEQLEADWYRATFNSGLVPRSVGAIVSWVLLLVILFAAPVGLAFLSSRRKGRAK